MMYHSRGGEEFQRLIYSLKTRRPSLIFNSFLNVYRGSADLAPLKIKR